LRWITGRRADVSPNQLVINKGAHAGVMEAEIDGDAADDWGFLADNEWSSDINWKKVPMEGWSIGGLEYPVKKDWDGGNSWARQRASLR